MPNNFTTAHDILADLHGKLDKSKRIGDKLTARCPAHEDKTPSLSVKIGDNDCVILKCFAGCTTEEVVDALGWTMRDLFASDANRPPVSSSRRGLCPRSVEASRRSRSTPKGVGCKRLGHSRWRGRARRLARRRAVARGARHWRRSGRGETRGVTPPSGHA